MGHEVASFSVFTRDIMSRWLDLKAGAEHIPLYYNVPLYWFGSGAEALGLTGEADPDMARRVLCDGVAPDGEQLGLIVNFVYQNVQAVNYFPQPAVAYSLVFRAHQSVHKLMADTEKRQPALEAHREVVAGELAMLEHQLQLGLVGVEARYLHTPESEIVFLATGHHMGGWHPLGTARDVFNVVLPAVRLVLRRYDRRIGEELKSRAGVKVKYKVRPNSKERMAVVK